MADVNANIGIHIDTSQSLAQIKNLQRQLAQLYTSINKGSAAAAAAQKGLATNLMNTINAGGKFYAQMGTIRTSTESFTHALEKNKLTMREYFRFAGGSTRTFGRLFKSEFDTIGKVAEERVKRMQTQYIKLGRDASGAMRAISVTPTTLNMKEYGNQVAVAAQRQAILNQLLKQGSTNLLNFGKNTQWAGRQLMVGFTIPLAYFGTAAAKTFMDLEAQAIKFRRVYGDMFTTTAETNKALADIQALAEGFTKYGVAVSKTMEMAASAAAMGKTGAELTAQVAQATRLAVLGNVEQEQALETTISLTNAFGLAAEELTGKINFLNAVENQTVTAIEDLTIAIPKAGPVVKSLGGSVEDLAFFLTAMREGGINASQGANALKSGLASLINPTEKAAAMLSDMGINIDAIIEGNFGNLKETVIDFAQALDQLAPLERSRAIEQLFGKFQFARLDALFTNVTKEGGQAARVLDLAGKSVEELAILSERELKAVEDAIGTNFKAAVEELKLSIAPIGKEFLKAITPVVKFLGDLFEKFNNLSDGSKRFIVVLSTLLGLVGPTLLMTFGLVANGAANLIKLFVLMRQGFLKLTGNSTNLAQQTQYLNSEQMEAAVVAASLNQAHTRLTQQFTLEATAVMALRDAYVQATTAAMRFAATNPGMMLPGFKGLGPIKGGGAKGFNKGTMEVPGYQKGIDSVPAMLTPGEAVIPEPIAQDDRFKPLVAALVSGEIKKYKKGTVSAGDDYAHVGGGKLTNIDDIIAKSGGGLSQTELRQAQMYKDILVATGQSGAAQAYGSLAYSFDSALNKAMAKQGIPFAAFERAWLDRPNKWATSGFTASQASIVDRAILEQIKSSGVTTVTDRHVDAAFRNLPESIKATQTYRSMAQLHDKIGSYSLGKGLGSTPATSKQILEQAKKAGIIKDYRVEERVSSKGKQAIKSLYVVTNDGKEVYLGRGSKANRIYLADKSLSAAQKAAAKPKFVVGVGETIKTKDGRVSTVTGQTGKAKPSGMKVIGGGVSDRRVIGGSNIASIFPRGFKGPRLTGIGAQGGFGEGATQAERAAGIKGGSISSEYRQKQTQVQQNLDKLSKETQETTKQTRTLGQKFGVGANAFSGLAIMGSFMGGKIGEVSQKLAPLAIGLSTIAMLLPGLKSGLLKFGTFLAANPFIAVGLAIAGIAVAAKLVDEKMKKQARAQSDYIDAISATTEKMKKVGEITDEVGASQIMQMRRQGATANKFTTGYERAGQQFGTSFLESEVGQEIFTNFQNSLAKGGTNAVKQIALELSAYVSDGLMSAEDANSVARSIGINMSNMALAANIQGQLVTILGPNGEDLTKNPLQVRIDIVEQSRNSIKDFATAISEETKKIGVGGEKYDVGFARDMVAAGAASGVQALEMLQAQRDAQAIMLEDKIKELEIEKSKTKDKEKQAQIESQITTLKSQQASDDQKLAGQRSQIIKDQLALFKASQKVAKGETAFFEGAKQQVVTKFEGDPFVKKFLEESAGLDSKELEVQLLTIVGAGDLTPQAAINFINLFGKDEAKLDTVINSKIAIENPDKFAQLQNLVGGLQGKKAKTVGLDIMTSLTAPGEESAFDDRLAAITLLQQMDGKEINVAAFLEGNVLGKLDKLVPLLNKVEEKKEINVKVLQELEGETDTDLQGLIDDWEHYVNLPTDIQKTATQTYLTIYKTIGKKELAGELMNQTGGSQVAANFLGERTSSATVRGQLAARLTKEQFAPGQAPNTIPGGPGGEDGDGKNRDTTLDNLLTRLKFIRKASIDAEGGVKELLRITSGKGLTNFTGVMQQLMAGPKGGANREFISFLENMDNKTRKTYMTIKNGEVVLTKQGKALKEAFNEKVIGEYQVANRQALQDTKAQGAALLKLQASGVDSATALEMVADANLAVAINSKNITGKELRQMAADAKTAKDEVEKLNLEVLGLAQSLKEDIGDATKANQALLTARQGGIVDPEILDFISKDMSIINKILQSGINDQTIADIVKAKNALKDLGDQTEALINPAEKAMQTFLKMKDAAFKLFDVQQRQAQSKFNAGMGKTVNTMTQLGKIPQRFQELSIKSAIAAAEKEIQGLNDQIRRIQDLEIRPIDIEIEAKESAINDIMKALESQAAGMQRGLNLPAAAYKDVVEGLRDQINEIELDLEFNPEYGARLVEQLQDQISDMELEIELNFSRPIADLQEESSDLSNDLTLMDRIADQINSKYDAQAEALQKVSDINQEILNQQKSQLDIAGALTQGDIAAAARAAQEARAQAAAGAAQRAGGVLDAARQAEIAGIRSPGGLTRAQIEERQFQIGQQIYQLEEQSEIKQRSILAIQDQIREIEEIRTQKQRDIRDIQDQIAAGDRAREAFLRENVVPIENAILALQEAKRAKAELIAGLEQRILDIQYEILDPLQAEADILQKEYDNAIDLIDKEKQHWEDQELALIVATEETKKFAAEAGNVKDAFAKAKNIYDEIKSKTITITVQYVTVGSPGTSTGITGSTVTGKMYGGKIKGYMGGGKVKTMYAAFGKKVGSDTVPAMLTPGEFVVNRASSRAFAPFLNAINESKYPSILARNISESRPIYQIPIQTSLSQPSYEISTPSFVASPTNIANASYSDNSSAVYNYNVGISVGGTSASPDSIAKAVMNEIKYLDSQRVRNQKVS